MTPDPAPDLFAERDAFGLAPIAGPVPDEVLAGLAKLAGGPPLWGTEQEWSALIDRMRSWTTRWHWPAANAGWRTVELFGLSPDGPQVRRDLMGGAWLANLHGHQTIAVDTKAITLVVRTSSRMRVYRCEDDQGAVMAWRLCGG